MKKVLSIFSCLGVAASIVSCSSSALALEPPEIYAEAEKFTVQIDGAEPGTGTIIANDNGTYTVLTCWHVMDTEDSYQITTADDSTHQVDSIKNIPDVDLALISFSSGNIYPVAELGDSAIAKPGLDIYVVGYNAPFPGAIEREYLTETAQVQGRREAGKNGYQIIHSAIVTSGSSGGGIFDNEARLIGVNGEVFSEANTGKAYGNGVPLEIYLAAEDSLAIRHKIPLEIDLAETYDITLGGGEIPLGINSAEIDRRVPPPRDEAIRINPDDANYYFYRATIHSEKEEHHNAIADYSEAIRLDPDDAVAYNYRGTHHAELGEYQSAIFDYDEAIRLSHSRIGFGYEEAYYNRGNSYAELGEYQRAITDYDEAIRLDPNFADAYNNRGNSYKNLKNYPRAIANFDEAIRLDPNLARAYVNRGNIYHLSKNYESAIADFDEAIRLNPNLARAYNYRGYSHKAIGNNKFATKDFEQARELYKRQGNTENFQYFLE